VLCANLGVGCFPSTAAAVISGSVPGRLDPHSVSVLTRYLIALNYGNANVMGFEPNPQLLFGMSFTPARVSTLPTESPSANQYTLQPVQVDCSLLETVFTILKHTSGNIKDLCSYHWDGQAGPNVLQYAVSFSVRDCEDGVCGLLTIYHIIRRQQRRALGAGSRGRTSTRHI
jgi:hypothetical protein